MPLSSGGNMNKIKGVNLGGWLVLERWMTPELFEGYKANDEYHLLAEMGDARVLALKTHRDSFITESDFVKLHEIGINTVRLPIGYWLFEDQYPYLKADGYVSNAFKWGKKHNLKILLDVHAAPGCQNGFDNGGLAGICEWPNKTNIDKTLDFISQLAKTYQTEVALLGIEVLNEPRWDIDIALIQEFYISAYKRIRQYLDESYMVVFHDAFRLDEWKDFFKEQKFSNVVLDTHMYQVFSKNDSLRNPNEVIEKTSVLRYQEITKITMVPLIVGEWSLGIHEHTLKQLQSNDEKEVFYKVVGNALLTTYENTRGWFFWNYKLSDKSTDKHVGWSFLDVIQRGWIPQIK